MPAEELYDGQNDPHEIHNLAQSPEYRSTLVRLRGALESWIEETHDEGRKLEPAELAARKGMTKEGTNPLTGYTPDGNTNSPTAKPKRGIR